MRISRFWKGTDSIRGGGDGSVQVQDPRDVFSHKIVPNHLPAIVNSPDQIKKKYDLRSLKWVISGGAPLSKELDRRVHGELPWSYDNATGIGASTDTLEESRRYGAAGMLSSNIGEYCAKSQTKYNTSELVATCSFVLVVYVSARQQTLALPVFKQNLSSINFRDDEPKCNSAGQLLLGSDYYPIMMNWNMSTDCCNRGGITCNSFTGDVICGIYGYPIEIQALFFMALRCSLAMLKLDSEGKEFVERIMKRLHALSFHRRSYFWIDFQQLNDIYRYKTEEYSHTAVNKFNAIPDSIPDWVFDFMPTRGGYFVGNVSPARMDFRWFALGNCVAILSSLATPEQASAIMDLFEARWEELVGEMPIKICYPAIESHEWRIVTGCDPKNTRWSYHNGGSWPGAAAVSSHIKYFRVSASMVANGGMHQNGEATDSKLERQLNWRKAGC
ncbi:hypothetical protein L1887_20742 [Cichorium endivia]|nr:hypothetical protein L1887_20742 [Cichorium endivia]